MKKSFILHYDSLSVIDKMSDDQVWKLLRMMKSYHNGNTYICDDFAVELVFEQFRNQFDRDLDKYHSICERNARNWSQWWRPKETRKPSGLFGNPNKPKKADNDSDNDSDSDNKKDKDNSKKKSTTFIPPTLDMVVNYFREKWYTDKSAKKAFDYYDVANRSDSKWNKVRNWKQKMQSVWFKEENEIKVEYPNKIDWYYENVRSKLDRLTPNPWWQQSDEWMEVVNNAKEQYGEQFFLDAKTAYVKHQNSI